jgi:hypothetical protein
MSEIVSPPTVNPTVATKATEHLARGNFESEKPRMTDGRPHKIFLPRRSELRFGPQPYYYEASRTGVLPTGYSTC